MALVDVDSLLTPIDADAPSGPDLEYDPEFQELERLARGKPEQQFGETIIPAEEPDWRAVGKAAAALLMRTKDLRACVLLARAALRTSGFVDFAACIRLMHDFLDQHWSTVHPQLDPEDNDPTMRVNSLIALCDTPTMLRDIRDTPLVESRRLGRFGLREVMIAKGELPMPANSSEAPPTMAAIEAAFADAAVEQLQATGAALTESIAHIGGMETKLMSEVGAANAADFAPILKQLRDANRIVQDQLARRGAAAPAPAAENGSDAPSAGATTFSQPAAVVSAPGEIRTRQDVITALGRIRDYYERNEPSSPLPLLLMRAERLVNKSFLEILTDFAPDGVPQAKLIGGVKDDADSSY